MSDRSGNEDLYRLPIADPSSVVRLTTDSGHDRSPAWSPDGTRIAFSSDRDGDFDIWTMSADGGIRATSRSDRGNSTRSLRGRPTGRRSPLPGAVRRARTSGFGRSRAGLHGT